MAKAPCSIDRTSEPWRFHSKNPGVRVSLRSLQYSISCTFFPEPQGRGSFHATFGSGLPRRQRPSPTNNGVAYGAAVMLATDHTGSAADP